jgi:hypothetical protein
MADDVRTDEQFWADVAKTIEEARQLPEWKKQYRVNIYGEERTIVVESAPKES